MVHIRRKTSKRGLVTLPRRNEVLPCTFLIREINNLKKEPKCKYCGGPHYQTFCLRKPKKQIATRKPIQPSRRPLKAKAPLRTRSKPKPLKKSRIKAQSQSYRSTQIKKADRIFSKYIRLRYAVNFFARCVTCGRVDHYSRMQNGHYIGRRIMATRYDEKNCNVQCSYCNETLGGNLVKYKAYLQRTYGPAVIPYLQQKAQKHGPKLATHELQVIIDKYTVEVDILLKKDLHSK